MVTEIDARRRDRSTIQRRRSSRPAAPV